MLELVGEDKRTFEVAEGSTTVLGRNSILGDDKAVSRRHVEVVCSGPRAVKVTVVGTNESAVVRAGAAPAKLKKGESAEIGVGDSVQLLPGRYAFVIRESVGGKKPDAAAPAAPIPKAPSMLGRRASTLGDEMAGIAEYASLLKSTSRENLAAVVAPPAAAAAPPPTAPADGAIVALRAVFPSLSDDVLKKSIQESGSVEKAIVALMAQSAPKPPAPVPPAVPRPTAEPAPGPPAAPVALPAPVAPVAPAPVPVEPPKARQKEEPEEEQTPQQKLAAVFPDLETSVLLAVLKETGGDLEAAAAKLILGGGAPPPPPPPAAAAAAPAEPRPAVAAPPPPGGKRSAAQKLSAIFPEVEISVIELALKESGGDLEAASAWLSGSAAAAPAAPVRAAAGAPAARPPVEDKPRPGVRRELKWEDGVGVGLFGVPYHYRGRGKKGKKRPFPGGDDDEPARKTRHAVIKLDFDHPSQSMRDLKQDPCDLLLPACRAAGDNAQYVLYNFQTMLEREQDLYGDWFVFYHVGIPSHLPLRHSDLPFSPNNQSYSYAHLLYEVQAELARNFFELPDDFAPLPRLLQAPFHGLPLLEMLLEDFKKMGGQDHNPKFRALAISVSVSLFAPGSEAPPTSCFQMGYSCMDLSFRGLLTGLFESCRVPKHRVESLADEVISIGEKYHLATAPYMTRPGGPAMGFGFGFGGGAAARAEAPGQMLQIFIHKEFVDSVAYLSAPYGVPLNKGPPSTVLARGLADGQARIVMHPALLTDPSKCRLFFYSANPSLASPDPEMPGSRGAMILELRKALAPIIGEYSTLKKALRGVQGIASSQDP